MCNGSLIVIYSCIIFMSIIPLQLVVRILSLIDAVFPSDFKAGICSLVSYRDFAY